LYKFIISPMRATFPAHHIVLDLLILVIFYEEYKLQSSSFCDFLCAAICCSVFIQNVLSPHFSNTFFLSSSLRVGNQVLRLCKATGKIVTFVEGLKETIKRGHKF